jgi:hypothetical protein
LLDSLRSSTVLRVVSGVDVTKTKGCLNEAVRAATLSITRAFRTRRIHQARILLAINPSNFCDPDTASKTRSPKLERKEKKKKKMEATDHNITSYEPFPTMDSYSAPTTPQHDHDAPIPTSSDIAVTPSSTEPFSLQYEGPLYTEINIPLPHIPAAAQNTTSASPVQASCNPLLSCSTVEKQRGRSRTLSSLSPFRHRRSSSVSTSSPTSPCDNSSEEWPRIRKDVVKSREVNAMMNLRHQNKRGRSGTIEALAVVPAVLVLSAELFTPGEEGAQEGRNGRKDSGVGRWEDGIR